MKYNVGTWTIDANETPTLTSIKCERRQKSWNFSTTDFFFCFTAIHKINCFVGIVWFCDWTDITESIVGTAITLWQPTTTTTPKTTTFQSKIDEGKTRAKFFTRNQKQNFYCPTTTNSRLRIFHFSVMFFDSIAISTILINRWIKLEQFEWNLAEKMKSKSIRLTRVRFGFLIHSSFDWHPNGNFQTFILLAKRSWKQREKSTKFFFYLVGAKKYRRK